MSDTVSATPTGGDTTDGPSVPDNPISDESEEQEEDPWESVLYEFENGLLVHEVEYDKENGTADVYLSVEDDASSPASAVITDATWEETGTISQVEVDELSPSQQQIYTISLANVGKEALTIDPNEGELWAHVGEGTDLRTDEETEYPIVVGGIAGTIILILLVSLQQFSGRYRNKAKNPIGDGGMF
ncbi:hypothetical protein [Halorubrum distributum]|uniref:hypothetical protein n=1 Tax=Halorubrum distributum TaxID=29283 RepID=UPI001267A4B2|nr:hypothetical protein [Halorubrum arcis]